MGFVSVFAQLLAVNAFAIAAPHAYPYSADAAPSAAITAAPKAPSSDACAVASSASESYTSSFPKGNYLDHLCGESSDLA